jgi:hypothetical protein
MSDNSFEYKIRLTETVALPLALAMGRFIEAAAAALELSVEVQRQDQIQESDPVLESLKDAVRAATMGCVADFYEGDEGGQDFPANTA